MRGREREGEKIKRRGERIEDAGKRVRGSINGDESTGKIFCIK